MHAEFHGSQLQPVQREPETLLTSGGSKQFLGSTVLPGPPHPRPLLLSVPIWEHDRNLGEDPCNFLWLLLASLQRNGCSSLCVHGRLTACRQREQSWEKTCAYAVSESDLTELDPGLRHRLQIRVLCQGPLRGLFLRFFAWFCLLFLSLSFFFNRVEGRPFFCQGAFGYL